MAFFGKEYTFVKQENFENFAKAMGIPAEKVDGFINNHPNQKLVKDGDNFTLITDVQITFKNGVQFDEKIAHFDVKTTCTLDGNKLIQVQNFDDGGVFTVLREFSDDQLILTMTSSKISDKAVRYFKAV